MGAEVAAADFAEAVAELEAAVVLPWVLEVVQQEDQHT